jgi:MoxR-like ATPase
MSKPYEHPHMKRMKEGIKIDKETTETFIKAPDPVGIESDKMGATTYTAEVANWKDCCLACDKHIDTGDMFIEKQRTYPDVGSKPKNSYCISCACEDIERLRKRDREMYDRGESPTSPVDDSIHIAGELIDDKRYRGALTPLVEYRISLKEVKMTDKEVEDYDDREGLDALFSDRPKRDEEDTPDEVLEIEEPSTPHIPTIMSKLTGSVDMPEEFKFADSAVFYTMLRNIYRGKSILVLGPSGCGKSSLGKILADITNKPYYAFNFGDTMNPAAKILGDTKYDSVRGTFFKKSRFVSALQDEKGSFIMLDEVTRDRTGDLANILMPVLDGQKYLALDESDDADTVDINAKAFFYATANIGREYLGAAHDLDRAWKDRFTGGIYELEYLPQGKEQELLMIRSPTIDEKDAHRITDFAQRVRDLYKAEEISTAVSTRMCLSTAEFVVDGMSLIDALKQVCLPFYPIVAGDDSERVQIIQTIQSMGD